MIAELVAIILPVVACIGVGFGWAKTGLPFEREFVTRIVMNIAAPCLILSGLGTLQGQAQSFYLVIAIAFALVVLVALPSAALLRLLGQPVRSFLPVTMNGNIGNLGLPLCLFAFGPEGLGLALGFYVVGSFVVFVGSPLILGRQAAWKTFFATPIIYATGAALLLLYFEAELPRALHNTFELLGNLLIPLMVISLGHALGTFGIVRPGLAMLLSMLRLVLGFLFGLAIVEILDLEGILRGVVIVQASMPVAVFNYLLASRYDRHPEVVASSIVISTLISLLSLPLLLGFAIG